MFHSVRVIGDITCLVCPETLQKNAEEKTPLEKTSTEERLKKMFCLFWEREVGGEGREKETNLVTLGNSNQ